MPEPTTEAEYHLPNHSSHGSQGLAGLAKCWLNLGAQGGGEIQIHFSKDKKPLSVLQITALQFPEGFSVVTQITRHHVFFITEDKSLWQKTFCLEHLISKRLSIISSDGKMTNLYEHFYEKSNIFHMTY